MKRRWLLACVAIAAACSAEAGGSVQPVRSEVLPRGSSVLVSLPDGAIIVEAEGRLLSFDPRDMEREPSVVGPATEIGEVHAAVPLDGAVLVLAAGGSFILRDGSWVPSPLAEALDGPILDAELLPSPTGRGDGDLWIATASSLYRVRDGEAQRFELSDDLSSVQLAVAQRPEGPALWVLLPDRVLEVWRDRSGAVRSASLVLDSAPTSIGGDATLTGWLEIDGRLHSIGADRRLVDHGVEVGRLLTSSLSREAWMIDPAGGAWLFADDRLLRVRDVTFDPTQTMAVASDGSLYVSADTIARYAPRRDARVLGAPSGSLLVIPQVFLIESEGAPSIEARVDGASVEIASDPVRVELDPAALGEGTHELFVEIRYDDGTLPITDRRTFEVITDATWADDVEPLYEANCAFCHGPDGAAVTRLGTMEDWQMQIDIIVRNVEQGRMPLGRPPLAARDVALLQAWQVGGFRE